MSNYYSGKCFKRGIYKGIKCDSSYELAFVMYYLDKGRDIRRCDKVYDYFFEDEWHEYHPDFTVNEKIYEIKGIVTDRDIAKFSSARDVIVVTGKSINTYLRYARKVYGYDFTNEYDVKLFGESEDLIRDRSPYDLLRLQSMCKKRLNTIIYSGIDFSKKSWLRDLCHSDVREYWRGSKSIICFLKEYAPEFLSMCNQDYVNESMRFDGCIDTPYMIRKTFEKIVFSDVDFKSFGWVQGVVNENSDLENMRSKITKWLETYAPNFLNMCYDHRRDGNKNMLTSDVSRSVDGITETFRKMLFIEGIDFTKYGWKSKVMREKIKLLESSCDLNNFLKTMVPDFYKMCYVFDRDRSHNYDNGNNLCGVKKLNYEMNKV